jgi:hypothetical protein
MLEVAGFAATAAGVLVAAITLTWRWTRSAASAGRRSYRSSAPAILDPHVLTLDVAGFLPAFRQGLHQSASFGVVAIGIGRGDLGGRAKREAPLKRG